MSGGEIRKVFFGNLGAKLPDTVTAAQWRIAITHWVWEAYEKVNSKSTALFRSAQHVGFANCRCGCENDKIRVANLRSYKVGLETDPPMEKLTKEEAENLALMDKTQRLQERKEKKKNAGSGLKGQTRLKKT